LEASTLVDGIQVFEHQNPTGIGEHTTRIVSINGEPFPRFILFVVRNLITPKPLAHFNLQFWH
jgi:hypothetical protein